MNKFRFLIIDFLIGDYSYVRNVVIDGKISLREKHWLSGCAFVNDSYVYTSYARFPQVGKPSE